jgi:cobalt/nickel transport system permease protein
VLAAGIFVAQMLNFPVGGGTTGHLVGAALAAVLLGPYAAVVILMIVLIVQAFLFGDGGVTALGLNILNMAIVSSFVAYAVYMVGKTVTSGKVGMYITYSLQRGHQLYYLRRCVESNWALLQRFHQHTVFR